MKKILVPIDFSLAARNASEYAASLANQFGAALQLLYVFMEPVPTGEAPTVWDPELQQINALRVMDEVEYLRHKYDVVINGGVELGFTSREISKTAEQEQMDLIIMGMKGTGHNKWMGSTVIASIRNAKVPILVVPENVTFTPFKSIALASDFDERVNYSCLKTVFEFLQKFDASLNVVHVQDAIASSKTYDIVGKINMEHYLNRYKHTYYTIAGSDVEQGLDSFIMEHATDLLVMVAHRHNIFERLFGTLHTKAMSYHSQLPLLILHDT